LATKVQIKSENKYVIMKKRLLYSWDETIFNRRNTSKSCFRFQHIVPKEIELRNDSYDRWQFFELEKKRVL